MPAPEAEGARWGSPAGSQSFPAGLNRWQVVDQPFAIDAEHER
jgi:hypothetical protein